MIILPAIHLFSIIISTTTPFRCSAKAIDGIDCAGLERCTSRLDIEHFNELSKIKATSDECQDVTGLAPRSPFLPFPPTLPRPLSPRRLPSNGNYTWRLLSSYVIEPVASEFHALSDDLDQAYASYQRALLWIHADHSPLTNIRLTFGDYEFHIRCPNPMNLDNVKDVLALAVFAGKIFFAAYLRIAVWSLTGTAYLVTFGVIPFGVVPFARGNQHAVVGANR
ncbi:MAG: hypothetical protein Q9218_004985 [Villophora microphyllina]